MEFDVIKDTDVNDLLVYLLGFGTFFVTVILDFLNNKYSHLPKKEVVIYYSKELIYTAISVVVGILICNICKATENITKIVAIAMGLVGSTLIRKILEKEEEIADSVIESGIKKIKSTIESTSNSTSSTKIISKNNVPETKNGEVPSKDEWFKDEEILEDESD
jgi:hypothetical protein